MNRIGRLRERLRDQNLDLVALMPTANLQYFTGLNFHPGKRLNLTLIALGERSPCIVLPALEVPGIRDRTNGVHLYPWEDADGPLNALAHAIAHYNLETVVRIGIENPAMRVMELRALETTAASLDLRLETCDITPQIAAMRMVKDADEQASMSEAARRVEVALQAVVKRIAPGMTERELSRICADEIHAVSEGESFTSFAAFGPNTANPHHLPGDRKLQQGDLIIIDCGAVHNGYASDITRTFALGDPGDEAKRIYDIVKRANAAARTAVRPGVTGEQIDHAARQVIEEAGYGDRFIHRTGHGLGLDIHPCHEAPDLMAGSNTPFEIGTTFTIEPGIYIEDLGGVRIEDDVVITEDGHKSFTSFNRDLMILR